MRREEELKLSYEPVWHGFNVRLMSPLGSYPEDTIHLGSSVLVVSPELCFSIARLNREDLSYSEVDSLTPMEIPLVSSVMLSSGINDTYIFPYPTDDSVTLETDRDEEITEDCISQCRMFLLTQMAERRRQRISRASAIHEPPATGGLTYDLVSSIDIGPRVSELFKHLVTAEPVMIRGVSSLLKANMAWRHAEFRDAACIFLWIALDAAHSLTLKRLRDAGNPNPSSKDAARYFDSIAGWETPWDKFFEQDYENRIRAIHPHNRFGAEARPQLIADDFLELNEMLVAFYRFLVSGEFSLPKALRH